MDGAGRVWLTGIIVDEPPPDAEYEGKTLIVSVWPVTAELEVDRFVPFPPFMDLFALDGPADGGTTTNSVVRMAEAECGEPWETTIAVQIEPGGLSE